MKLHHFCLQGGSTGLWLCVPFMNDFVRGNGAMWDATVNVKEILKVRWAATSTFFVAFLNESL